MALREIIVLPDKRLRQVSDPVKAVNAQVRALVDDMFETMYEAPGVGLAAIQIGVAAAGRHGRHRQEGRAEEARRCSSTRK